MPYPTPQSEGCKFHNYNGLTSICLIKKHWCLEEEAVIKTFAACWSQPVFIVIPAWINVASVYCALAARPTVYCIVRLHQPCVYCPSRLDHFRLWVELKVCCLFCLDQPGPFVELQGIAQCLVPYPFESAETSVYCPVCSD